MSVVAEPTLLDTIAGAVAGGLATRRQALPPDEQTIGAGPDYALVGAALALAEGPAAITSTDGALLAANDA